MRKNLLIGAVALLVIAGAVGFRFLQLLPYPKGEFNWLESPNERHRAYLYSLTDMGFFGRTHVLYRMKVEMGTPSGTRTVIHEQDLPRDRVEVRVDLAHLDEVILWARDSMKVTYRLGSHTNVFLMPF